MEFLSIEECNKIFVSWRWRWLFSRLFWLFGYFFCRWGGFRRVSDLFKVFWESVRIKIRVYSFWLGWIL